MRFTRLLLALPIVSSLLLSSAYAQTADNTVNTGLPAYGTYTGSTFDSVQMGNGNLHIQIPLISVPGGGFPRVTPSYMTVKAGRLVA